MTISDIEKYLGEWHLELNHQIAIAIQQYKDEAVRNRDEELANHCWCLQQIYYIQKDYLSVYDCLREKKYKDAWILLERIDIAISSLEKNTRINNAYHIQFILSMIKEYEKLFPYKLFFSRESIIKKQKCSICGQEFSLRKKCNHIPGKLYMGEICNRVITEMELCSISIVTDPFDKYAIVEGPDIEYDYSALDYLMAKLSSPYDPWHVTIEKRKRPEYQNVNRNDKCPCGSGKKYKYCCLGSEKELMNHFHIMLTKK